MSMQRHRRAFLGLSVLVILALLLATPIGAMAQGNLPPRPERPPRLEVSLDELQAHYGVLKDIEGPVGVVIELFEKPAAVVYTEQVQAGVPEGRALAQAAAQVQSISEQQERLLQTARAQGIQFTELYRTQRVYNGIWMYVQAKDVARLASLPGVKALHPMLPKEIDHKTSVPLIGALQAWSGDDQYQGEGIRIGVIDTGVDYLHADFGGPGDPEAYAGQDFTVLGDEGGYFGEGAPKVVGGYDFAGDDYDAYYNPYPQPDPDPMDCNGHGTHVAGTIAGFGVLPDGSTYVEDPDAGDTYASLAELSQEEYIDKFYIGPGVAPKAQIYALRVFGCSGSTDLVTQAIEWAMDPNQDGDLSDHLDVINMSLGALYGSEYDPDSVAANNAAAAGIIVVAAAGNSGDSFYITGSPGVARHAISVASTINLGAVVDAFEVVSAPENTIDLGLYPAKIAAFGPQDFDVQGNLVYADPTDGCDALNNAADVEGKIALIDRGNCTFVTKVRNAQTAGAIGVLVVNNEPGFPITMAGSGDVSDITIPAVMTDFDTGAALKDALGQGDVVVRLYSADRDGMTMLYPPTQDHVSSFSSRGPARVSHLLKPDVAAPGETVFSAAARTGNQGVAYQGTSMATPHVAGAMALLRQAHPDLSVAQLKALIMNTATPVAAIHTPSRVGAGRIDLEKALASPAVAYNGEDPGVVSLSFGQVTVAGHRMLIKPIVLENWDVADLAYNVSFDSRYEDNPGLTFQVTDATLTPISSISVPAGGQAVVYVKVDIDAAQLVKAADPTLTWDDYGYRQYFSEGGGYVVFSSTGSQPDLRVPVYIAARPAATMGVVDGSFRLDEDSGLATFTLDGVPVKQTYDAGGLGSIGAALELMYASPDESTSSGPADAADLRYVGVTYYPNWDELYFGVATYGRWSSPVPYDTEFDIYLDVDEDGTADYVIFNHVPTLDDRAFSYICNLSTGNCFADWFLNDLSGGYDTAIFDNNVMLLPIFAGDIGLNADDTSDNYNPDFNFWIVTWNREYPSYVDLTPVMQYNIHDQVFVGSSYVEAPGAMALSYNPEVFQARGSQGLLLFHFQNEADATTEVLPMEPADAPTVVAISRVGTSPTNANSVIYQVMFSEPVTGVDAADFALTTTGTISGASITNVTQTDVALYSVTVDTGIGDGTVRLDIPDTATITDFDGVPLANLPYTTGETYTIDKTPPQVESVTRLDADPTNAETVRFQVVFSEAVQGVDAADFSVRTSGEISGASVTEVSGSEGTYTVTVSTGTGDGTLGLDVAATADITDLVGNALANLPYTESEAYTIDKTPPQVESVTRLDADPTNAETVRFEVTFSEPVQGLDAADFALTTLGRDLDTAAVTEVSGADDVYTVTVSTGGAQANGYLTLQMAEAPTVTDLDGNALAPTEAQAIYRIKKAPIFEDVPFDFWANEHIEILYLSGITSGCQPGMYCPSGLVTRAQMAVFLMKAIHYPEPYTPPDVEPTFSDTAGHWAEDWIEALKAAGITSGYSDGSYRPDNPVSRAEMAVFLLKAIHGADYQPPAVDHSRFPDVPDDYWAKDWIEQLAAEGITSGYSDGTYRPTASVTRAQMAVFLVKAFELP